MVFSSTISIFKQFFSCFDIGVKYDFKIFICKFRGGTYYHKISNSLKKSYKLHYLMSSVDIVM